MIVSNLTSVIICFLSLLIHRNDNSISIRGIYGHPQLFWDKGYNLNELNVNAVFLHHKSITDTFMHRARAEKLKVYAEFATLNGENYVDKHPEAWAIDKSGQKVNKATWFMGVCPTDSGFIKYRMDELRTLATRYDLDGIWLDYLHWHAQFEDPDPILPETCFNNSCVNRFSREAGVNVPSGTIAQRADYILSHHQKKWRQWRASVIVEWVKQSKEVLKQVRPNALLGIYHCPWNDIEFDSARYKILGLDYGLLQKEVEVFSPMVYHKRMGRSADWVKENIEWFSGQLKDSSTKVWPIVQAHNDPGKVGAAEFESILRNAVSGRATGVMMFTSSSVAEDPAKIEVMQKAYGEWRD